MECTFPVCDWFCFSAGQAAIHDHPHHNLLGSSYVDFNIVNFCKAYVFESYSCFRSFFKKEGIYILPQLICLGFGIGGIREAPFISLLGSAMYSNYENFGDLIFLLSLVGISLRQSIIVCL